MLVYWRLQSDINTLLKQGYMGNRQEAAKLLRVTYRAMSVRDKFTRRIGRFPHTVNNRHEYPWKPFWRVDNLYDRRYHDKMTREERAGGIEDNYAYRYDRHIYRKDGDDDD
jgi:hypothetical protein